MGFRGCLSLHIVLPGSDACSEEDEEGEVLPSPQLLSVSHPASRLHHLWDGEVMGGIVAGGSIRVTLHHSFSPSCPTPVSPVAQGACPFLPRRRT